MGAACPAAALRVAARRRPWVLLSLLALLVAGLLALPPAAAEGRDLVGRWTLEEEGTRIDVRFERDGTFALLLEEGGAVHRMRGRYALENGALVLRPEDEPAEGLRFRWIDDDTFEVTDEDGAAYRLGRARDAAPPPAPGDRPGEAPGFEGFPAPPPAPPELPVPADLAPPLPLPAHPQGHIVFTRQHVQRVAAGGLETPVITPKLHVMNGDGSGSRPFLLGEPFTTFKEPCWQAPYRRLVFTSNYRSGASACFEDLFCLDVDGSRLQRITGGELRGTPPAGWAAVTGLIRDNVTSQKLKTPLAGVENRLGSPMPANMINIAVQGGDGRIYHPDPPLETELTIIDPVTGLPVKVGGHDRKRREWQYPFRIPRCAAGYVWIRVWTDRWIGNLVFANVKAGRVNDVGAIQLNHGNLLATHGSLSRDGRFAVGLGSIASYSRAENPPPDQVPTSHGGVDNVCVFSMQNGMVVGMFEASLAQGEMARDPKVSPDGRWIALAWGPFGAENLAVVGVEDLIAKRMTPRVVVAGQRLLFQATLVGCGSPAWTPDGSAIVFTRSAMSTRHLSGDLWMVNADGSGLRALTDLGPGAIATQPSVSPDGRRVAFTIVRPRQGDVLTLDQLLALQIQGDIYTMALDGTDLRRLTQDGASGEPAWGP